jgi:hypothetical protein
MKLLCRLRAVIAGVWFLGPCCALAQPFVGPALFTLDDFESYQNTNALGAVWPVSAGTPTIGLETNIICGGTQAMRLKYALSTSVNTNTVARNFGAPQDWSGFNIVTFNYGGASGNSTDNVFVRILDHLGGVLGSFTLTGATAYSACTNVTLDLSKQSSFTNMANHTDLHDVQYLVLGVVTGSSRGSGTIYFDNLVAGFNGNVITNPGFQDMNNDGVFGDGWNSSGVQQFLNFLPESTPGHATFYSDTTGNTGSVFWAASPAVPGTKYRLSVDADCESAWRADMQFGVEFLDWDFTTVLTQKIVTMFVYTNTPLTYKTYSMTAVVPPGVFAVRPVIRYTNSVHQSTSSQRGVLDNAVFAIETNRVLSIFAASIHKGLYSSGQPINYTVGGSYGRSFGAWLDLTMMPNGWRVDNRSIPGDNVTNLQQRFYHDETPTGADVVFTGVSMGNSGLHGSAIPDVIYAQSFVGYSNLCAMARSNGIIPMLSGGFPRDYYTTNEFGWIKKMDILINTFDVPSANFVGAVDNGIGHIATGYGSGDGIHYNNAGHYELFLCFVPSIFDALMAGKPTPQWSSNHKFVRVLADTNQPAPLVFTPSSTMHSFTTSFRLRAGSTGTVACISLSGTNLCSTIEVKGTNLTYVASSGQVITSSVPIRDGNWHEVALASRFAITQTWFYVDSILAGSVTERLTPVGFVLGGPGPALSRPNSPRSADYENWFIHRSALIPEEVQAQFQGALQQASLEVFAPLDDDSLVAGGSATNRAQSLAVVNVNGSNVYSRPIDPVSYSNGKINLNFILAPSTPYDIQQSLLMDFSTYSVVYSSTGAPPNGIVTFTDTNPPAPASFYRLVPH